MMIKKDDKSWGGHRGVKIGESVRYIKVGG